MNISFLLEEYNINVQIKLICLSRASGSFLPKCRSHCSPLTISPLYRLNRYSEEREERQNTKHKTNKQQSPHHHHHHHLSDHGDCHCLIIIPTTTMEQPSSSDATKRPSSTTPTVKFMTDKLSYSPLEEHNHHHDLRSAGGGAVTTPLLHRQSSSSPSGEEEPHTSSSSSTRTQLQQQQLQQERLDNNHNSSAIMMNTSSTSSSNQQQTTATTTTTPIRVVKTPGSHNGHPHHLHALMTTPGTHDRSGNSHNGGGGAGHFVMFSPASSIRESLIQLGSSAGRELEEIWDVVGYSTDDRSSQMVDLLNKFREVCEHKISDENDIAESFRQTITEAKDEIETTCAAFKQSPDRYLAAAVAKDGGPMTLTDELATLNATLDELRQEADVAKKELSECKDFIVDAHNALGIDMDLQWRDIETDLTLSRRRNFRTKMAEMDKELSTRAAAIIRLVKDCQHTLKELCIVDEASGQTDLDRQIGGSLKKNDDGKSVLTSKFRSPTCVGISSVALEELTKRLGELHGERRRRTQQLQKMGAEIYLLWEKLRVPQDVQAAFNDSIVGIGEDTLAKGEAEIKRLRQLKAEMLGKLIEEARESITELWDQVNAPAQERQGFTSFNVRSEDLFTDELLDEHEKYVAQLESRLEEMKPILRLIERRANILQERTEYEELQKDSDRLKQRGAAMARQLMEEEKMARRIKRDLPRLSELLVEKLFEWEKKHGENFVYQGKPYIQVMMQQEEEWNQYKAEEMQRKMKKKQEEHAYIENHFIVKGPSGYPAANKRAPSRTRAPSRPRGRILGDATDRANVRHQSRSRSRQANHHSKPTTGSGNTTNNKFPQRDRSRGRSHDVSTHQHHHPERELGQKQVSSRF